MQSKILLIIGTCAISMASLWTIKISYGCPDASDLIKHPIVLKEPGWTPAVKARLERIITEGAGQGLPVVFDFDNTLLCRDIGEATFATMVRDGILKPMFVADNVSPAFSLDGRIIALHHPNADLIDYYEAFQRATKHQATDDAPAINAYTWLTQSLRGLSPAQITSATKTTYAAGMAEQDLRQFPGETKIHITPQRPSYHVPFFYPEMIELLALFLQNGFEPWIISASNVWSVRWLVTHALNQKLRERGVLKGISPNHVIGISTLLKDTNEILYKDPLLAAENRSYAASIPSELQRFRLTTQVVYPVPAYYGKVTVILQRIGAQPYFVAGDSPNDLPMLKFGRHRLWIARLQEPDSQQKIVTLVPAVEKDGWIIQPVLDKQSPGFVSNSSELPGRLKGDITPVKLSLGILQGRGLLDGF